MTKNTDTNPHDFNDLTIANIDSTSGEMHDSFCDLLLAHDFVFTTAEKHWMLDRIVAEIREAIDKADQGDF